MSKKMILKELSRYKIGTFADVIYRNALLHPEDEAFIYRTERITFDQYNSRVNRLVNALEALGIQKGAVIGVVSWNCLEYADVWGAAMKGGFIISPFNPRAHANELEYLVNYSEAQILFVGPELVETIDSIRSRLPRVKNYISFEGAADGMITHQDLLADHSPQEPKPRVDRDDPFLIFYTSGTTGVPRGALYTQHRKLENTRIKALELGVAPGDRHLMILPMFHIGGDSHVWPLFYVGGCSVISEHRAFNPDTALAFIEQENITDLQIVPTQLVAMLEQSDFESYDLSSLKRIWYAASPMPAELLRKGLKVFGPVFAQGYGQTESGPQIAFLPRKAHQVLDRSIEEQKVLTSCGQPSFGVHVRIVDENNNDVEPGVIGEIIAQSDSIMVEYWRKPKETAEAIVDGWLHTGDLAYYDETGFIYIVDRKKDMIITGGENVYPREVEEVLYRHPAVAETAVIGVPDPKWVERVHAAIVLKKNGTATEKEIIAFCKKHMASYKAPKSVDFLDELPKSPQGKILKREIRKGLADS
jgi:acyl-CoA synthetase (AMP-forming)/AMP-acid ligase II